MKWKRMHMMLIFRKKNIITCKPGANDTQVAEANSCCSLRTYVKRAAVPPPSECPTTYEDLP